MEQQPRRACKRIKSKQKQNQARHIQIDHVRFSPADNAVVLLKDGSTVRHQSQNEDFL